MKIPECWERYIYEIAADPWTRQHRTFTSGGFVDAIECVYMLADDTREIAYIGQTKNLSKRLAEHKHQWWRQAVAIPAPHWWPYRSIKMWMNDVEAALIRVMAPAENVARVGTAAPCGEILNAAADLREDLSRRGYHFSR